MVSSPTIGDPLRPNKWCQGHGAEGVGQGRLVPTGRPGPRDAEYALGGAAHGVAEGNPGGAPASMAAGGLDRPHGDAP